MQGWFKLIPDGTLVTDHSRLISNRWKYRHRQPNGTNGERLQPSRRCYPKYSRTSCSQVKAAWGDCNARIDRRTESNR